MFIYTTFNYIRPSGRDTDDDDDPFAESKDEEEREDNKTLLLATYLFLMACSVTCQTSYTSMVFEGGIYVDFTQSSQIVVGVKSGVYLKKQGITVLIALVR